MSIWLIILLSVVGIVLLFFAYGLFKMRNIKDVESSKNVLNLTDQNFGAVTKSGLVMVDFWAAWCTPCKMIVPIMNDIADEYKGKVRIGKLNVDQSRQTAAKYGIRSIPTVIIFKNGKEFKRIVGVKSKSVYLKELNVTG
jgi:thioredoxin 1